MGYWVTSLGLIVFGFIAMFSIGRPFFLVGLAMLFLGRLRHRPIWFWPPLVAVIAFNVGWWAVAPLSCTATKTAGASSGRTTCSSLLGIDYSGTGTYNPSLDPANQAGLLLAGAAFVLVLAAMLWRARRARAASEPPDRLP